MKFALRQLAKSPGFTVVAVLSLALGIGANTAAFSLINAVLLEMLPVKEPERLIIFNWLGEDGVSPPSSSGWRQREPGSNKSTSTSFSIPTFEAFLTQQQMVSDVFAFAPTLRLNVSSDGQSEVVPSGQFVSGGYHIGLGIRAAAGRLFAPADDDPASNTVVVISYRYWVRRFGGEASAIGKPISINGVPVTIIGVTSPKFNGTMQVGEVTDVTLPLSLAERIERSTPGDDRRPTFWWVRIMARLKPGASAEQARASLEGVFHESIRGHLRQRVAPGAPAIEQGKIPLPTLRTVPGGQGLYEQRRGYEQSLRLLMGVVGLVLLVACANVANLLLARGAARRREIAVRLALGATRRRIIRQLLAESVLLASLGAAAGVAFAFWGARSLIAMSPFAGGPGRAAGLDAPLDWRVMGFTSALALLTGMAFGLMPALRATRLNLTEEFQGGTRSLGAGSGGGLAKSLMVVQVALSLVLLVGAGLFLRTLRNLQNVDVGFNRERLLLFSLDPGAAGRDGTESLALFDRMRDRIAQVAGVRRVSFVRVPPLSQSNWTTGINVPGYTPTGNDNVHANGIDPDYFATLEIPLLLGRPFTARDEAKAPRVAIVNQAFAKKFFGEENIVGRRIGFGGPKEALDTEVIGLIRDAQYSGVKTAPPPTMYQPFKQLYERNLGDATFVVRFAADPAALTGAVRAAVREVDADLPMFNVRTQEEQIDRLFTQERLFARLCTFFGALALLLAAVGLYGLMSYAVVRRTGEIGLRMALGALPGHVLGMIVRESMGLVILGVLLGIGAAWGATRAIATMLFGLSPNDPLTYALVAVLLITVAIIACFLPARRASKVEPMNALRSE
jgi:predicted permease